MGFEVVGLSLGVSNVCCAICYFGDEEGVALGAPEVLLLWGFTVSLGCEVFISTWLYDNRILTGFFPYKG
jgi:hypothetical protein